MATKPPAVTDWECSVLRDILTRQGLTHLSVTKRSPYLKIEAADTVGTYPVLRLRRDTVHLWTLEFPTSSSRWETTPYRGTKAELMAMVVADFSWVLVNQQNPA